MAQIYSTLFGTGSGSNENLVDLVVPAGQVWILRDVDGFTENDLAVLLINVSGTAVWGQQVHIASPYTTASASFRGRLVLPAGTTWSVEALGTFAAQASGYTLLQP